MVSELAPSAETSVPKNQNVKKLLIGLVLGLICNNSDKQ